MYKFRILFIAVMTSIMLLCLGGSALAIEKNLGAEDPNWVLSLDQIRVKVTGSSSALAMSLITVIYGDADSGEKITNIHPVNFPISGSISRTFSKQGKKIKQIIIDVTYGNVNFEVMNL